MLLIKNGRIIDPSNGIDDYLEILIDQGKIVEVGRGGEGGKDEVG